MGVESDYTPTDTCAKHQPNGGPYIISTPSTDVSKGPASVSPDTVATDEQQSTSIYPSPSHTVKENGDVEAGDFKADMSSGSDAEIDWKKKGNEAFNKGDYKKAIELYSNGIEYDPSNAALFSNRSAAYLKAEDYDMAERDAEMCIGINSKWAKGYWRKAWAFMEQQRYEEAVEIFDEGLRNCNNDEHLLVGKRRAQKSLEIFNAHNKKFPADEENMNDLSRGGAAAFMTAVDSQNKFGPESERNIRHPQATQEPKKPDRAAEAKSANQSSYKFPGTEQEEIDRIMGAPNFYATLHVSSEATTADMKRNYHKLARMLHPDKCQLEGADNAMKEVVQAYGTLTNPIKKTLYDQYISERRSSDAGGEQTYAEWEARQHPVNMPKWLQVLVNIKGCGWVISAIFIILMLPLIIVMLVVVLLVWIICLPYRTILRCCFPERYEQMLRDQEREREKLEEEAQDRMHAHL